MTDEIKDGVAVQKITLGLDGDNISAGEDPIIVEEKISDPRKIFQVIFANLKAGFRFVLDPRNKSSDQLKENGLLHKIIKFSDVYPWINGSEHDDEIILKVLDMATEEGKLKIFIIEHLREDHFLDVRFGCEIGRAIKNYEGQICLQNLRFYDTEPLKKEEFDSYNQTNISEQVKDIRKNIYNQIAGRAPKSGLELEAKLHRQDVFAEIDLKRRMAGMTDIKRDNEK